MCGRFGYFNKNNEQIKKQFRLKKIEFEQIPRYNIAPGHDVGVILNSDPETLTLARWGLIPSWAKDEKIGYKMINARSETIFEKPSYRVSIKKKRCLIPADCFYEWKKQGNKKQPYCIRLKSQETFAFAGIWDCWKDELVSCSIITCEPNALMASIHDRMPVIIGKDAQKAWLEGEGMLELMGPYPAQDMEAYQISTLVNSPMNTGCEVIEKI